MSNTEEKIDKILTILEEMNSKKQETSSKKEEIKQEIREFMLQNFNISYLDDKVEGEIYDFLVDSLWDIFLKRITY